MLVVGESVPLLACELVSLCEHEVVVAVGVDELVDRGRCAEHEIQRADALARLHVKPSIAIVVHALVLHSKSLAAHAGVLCAHHHVVDVVVERRLVAIHSDACGDEVILLSAWDEVYSARRILLAVLDGERLCAHRHLAISCKDQSAEDIVESLLVVLVEVVVHLDREQLHIRLLEQHVAVQFVCHLGLHLVRHVVLARLSRHNLHVLLYGHSLGASESDIIVGAELHSLNSLIALVEHYLLLRLCVARERGGNEYDS